MPITTKEVADFIAKSNQTYKPLDQLPIGRIAQRRKSSLANSRLHFSPYGLPLPKPPTAVQGKKTSLITRFERSNSATSSTFGTGTDDEPPSAVTRSAIFAQFTGLPLPSSPVTTYRGSLPPTAFQSAQKDTFGLGSIKSAAGTLGSQSRPANVRRATETKATGEKTIRATPSARREALGWGRRRNSDGPMKVVEAGREAKGLQPLTLAGSATLGKRPFLIAQDKENAPVKRSAFRCLYLGESS